MYMGGRRMKDIINLDNFGGILHLYISSNNLILFTIYLIQNKQEIQKRMAKMLKSHAKTWNRMGFIQFITLILIRFRVCVVFCNKKQFVNNN